MCEVIFAVKLELKHIILHLKRSAMNIHSFIERKKIPRLPDIYKCNYSETGFLAVDIKSFVGLNESLALDLMQISFVIRNQKIETDMLAQAIRYLGWENRAAQPYRYLIDFSQKDHDELAKELVEPLVEEIKSYVSRMLQIVEIITGILRHLNACKDTSFSDYKAYKWPPKFHKRGAK